MSEPAEAQKEKKEVPLPSFVELTPWLDDLMRCSQNLISVEAPEKYPEVFMEWKGAGEVQRKVWPSAIWWKFWDNANGPDRAMGDSVAMKDCRKLFLGFTIGVLQELNIETKGAQFFVASSFGSGLYQLMPRDWGLLDDALCGFFGRIEDQWKAREHASIEDARAAQGLDRRAVATDEDEFFRRRDEFQSVLLLSKTWLYVYDDVIANTMDSLHEMADDEREALDIESDSDNELEITKDETEEKKEPGDVTAEITKMRTEARALLEKANALAAEYNAGSAQRKLERRFDNGRSWITVGGSTTG